MMSWHNDRLSVPRIVVCERFKPFGATLFRRVAAVKNFDRALFCCFRLGRRKQFFGLDETVPPHRSTLQHAARTHTHCERKWTPIPHTFTADDTHARSARVLKSNTRAAAFTRRTIFLKKVFFVDDTAAYRGVLSK